MVELDGRLSAFPAPHLRFWRARRPAPRIAEPNRRQHVQVRRVGSVVGDEDANQDVVGVGFGIFDLDVEILIAVEYARVEQLELRIIPSAAPVLRHERRIRERFLRILVEAFHVAVRRRVIQVEVAFLDVFAVVAFVVGQTEEPLFEERVATVPKREREADVLMSIAEPGEAVLVPAVGAGSRVIVGKILPGSRVAAVVFADRPPGASGKVRTPATPSLDAPAFFVESASFSGGARVKRMEASCHGDSPERTSSRGLPPP